MYSLYYTLNNAESMKMQFNFKGMEGETYIWDRERNMARHFKVMYKYLSRLGAVHV